MKWSNKGRQFDEYAKKSCLTQACPRYYIFGAGLIGKTYLPTLCEYGCLTAFIDNSKEKQGHKFEGFEVINLDTYLQRRDGIILIAASKENTPMIANQLEASGLLPENNFFVISDFIHNVFPIISTYYYGKSFVSLAQITLTERCTLKCRKCAHGCYAVDNRIAQDLTLQQVYKSADSFFSKVDFISEFVLIGGEPLLYKELTQAIGYIGEKYRKQIGIFSITTNGTIVPKEDILRVCQEQHVLFRISNYAKQLPQLRESHARLVGALNQYNIPYVLGKEESMWMDYGFDYLDRGRNEDELTAVFDACRTPCREVRENRLYYCVMARSISDNLGFNVGQEDFLDLDQLSGENYKFELLEFALGYSKKGYLDMCAHCHGGEAKNHPVPAAEQK